MDNAHSENHVIPGELLFYTTPDGKVTMEIRVEGETIRMSQQMMADAREWAQEQYQLFSKRRREAAEHLAELELLKTSETEGANLISVNKR